MLVIVRVFDEHQAEVIYFEQSINAAGIITLAKSREPLMRAKGKAFTQGSVAFLGKDFVRAVREKDALQIEKTAMQAVMTAWLYDSIYCDVSEDVFKRCNLEFNLHPTGMVVYSRTPA